jgi:O-antigen/teichoic acid export membrane protein
MTQKSTNKNIFRQFRSILGRISWLARMDPHLIEVLRGASVAFTLKVLGVGLSFSFNVLLARLLGAQGAGIYYLSLTVITIATVFGRIGLGNALLRFTADNAAKGDWHKVAGVSRLGIRMALSTSFLVTLILVFSASWIAQSIFSKPDLTEPLRLMALSILPVSLINLYGELLKGLKNIRDSMLVQVVGIPLVSLPFLALLGGKLGVMGAATAYVVSSLLVLLFGVFLWRRATPQLRRLTGHFDLGLLMRSTLPLFWITFMNLVMSWTDTVLLGIWTDAKMVGIYGAAWRTAMLTSFILFAFNSIVAPKFAALYAQGNIQVLAALARNAAKLMALLTAPILLIFIVAPTFVLGLYGPEFTVGAMVLTILAIGQFINVATGSVGYLLMMTGHEKLMRNNIIFSAVLNIVLNITLIPKFGIVGAAVANSVSIVTMNLISVFLVYWKLSIFTIPIPKWIFNAK